MDRALIVRQPWIDLILSGEKVWEMRSTRTYISGRIGLIEQGSGNIVGACDLKFCSRVMFTNQWLERTFQHHRIPPEIFKKSDFKWRYAWLVGNAERFDKPIKYDHPKGAVTWVKI